MTLSNWIDTLRPLSCFRVFFGIRSPTENGFLCRTQLSPLPHRGAFSRRDAACPADTVAGRVGDSRARPLPAVWRISAGASVGLGSARRGHGHSPGVVL